MSSLLRKFAEHVAQSEKCGCTVQARLPKEITPSTVWRCSRCNILAEYQKYLDTPHAALSEQQP